jgi:hypothetical protein
MDIAWQHAGSLAHEGRDITLEHGRPPGGGLICRAGTDLDGVRTWRYRAGREEALCDLLNLLSEIAFVTALDADDDDEEEGDGDHP